MKIRLTGTPAECEQFTTALIAATAPGVVQQVSGFYPNRDGPGGRVYLDLALPGIGSNPPQHPAPAISARERNTQQPARPRRRTR